MDIFTELMAQYIPGILDEWKRDKCISREIHERIVELIKSKTSDEMASILDRGSIPYGRVYTLPELVNDPQAIAREMFVDIEHSLGFRYNTVSSPMKMSVTPTSLERPPPLLGQDSKEILIDLLGYTEEKIERLREESVI